MCSFASGGSVVRIAEVPIRHKCVGIAYSVRRSQLGSRLASVFYEVLVFLHSISSSFPS